MSAQLLKAAGKGDVDRAMMFLEHIHFQNKKGESALHLAIAEDELEMVEFLCSNGANVNLKEKRGGYTTIMLCLAQQPPTYVSMVEILLKHQADLTLKDSTGQTALHLASQYESVDAAQLLLKSKDNLDIADAKKMTPLMVASGKGNVDILQLLINKGHKVNASDDNGNTALHWAVMREAALDVVSLLISSGAKPTTNNAGNTPLHAHALHADVKAWPTDVAQVLLEKFPEIQSTKNAKGKTADALVGGADDDVASAATSLSSQKKGGNRKNSANDGPNEVAIANARAALAARAKEKAAKRKSLIPTDDDDVPVAVDQDTSPAIENTTSGVTMAIILAVVVAFFAAIYAMLDASTTK
ncbi:Aste57867_21442 [Aphanomyces stellatus]|uniref:Aste57867_21442 protein n=1 Tax=Aphanomyces stellatus TaxID=120398 RepID=A0A485LMD4_9STRA|nr:hypothetical protein As57867_021373 [Aphanomyces stellatus]VFT98113.1 Aste57867_21442 [Aphanomyces stellatus]